MKLRPYQEKIISDVYAAWDNGAQNVLLQLATGGGKTVILSSIVHSYAQPTVIIAHRSELVSQLSIMLGRYGIRHAIVAAKPTVRNCIQLHIRELGRSYYDSHAQIYVASVDTLIKRDYPWFPSIKLVVQDEGHHPLRSPLNKWGKAASLFPTARGLYPTATPVRADGRGLGRHADGLIDALVIGVSMRELITAGFLTDYRIFAPPNCLDLSQVPVSASGDYSPAPLRSAVTKSKITGDVVEHYLKIAPGKQGVTFAVSVELATEIAQQFRDAGVKAEVISGKTPDLLRASLLTRFRNREIQQLVNVDLLGEGIDVPAIEVVSMARPTQSYCVYAQQFGRALRPFDGKPHALIIDHVGNVVRHGLPDAPRAWSLDRREKRAKRKVTESLRVCPQCTAVYERIARACPHCAYAPEPASRSAPEHVDGDLHELDTETLRSLRQEIERIDSAPRLPRALSSAAKQSILKTHLERQRSQAELRQSISQWAAYFHHRGNTDAEIYRRFYLSFGTDVLTAQTLNTRQANDLDKKIKNAIDNLNNNK